MPVDLPGRPPTSDTERRAEEVQLVDTIAAIIDRVEHRIEDRWIRVPHPSADSAHRGASVAGIARRPLARDRR
jgi:hypothetical protein